METVAELTNYRSIRYCPGFPAQAQVDDGGMQEDVALLLTAQVGVTGESNVLSDLRCLHSAIFINDSC